MSSATIRILPPTFGLSGTIRNDVESEIAPVFCGSVLVPPCSPPSDGVVSDGLSAIMTPEPTRAPFASNAFQFILKLPVSAVMPNCTDAPDSSGDGAANVSIPAGFNEVAQSLPVLYDLKSPESSQMENV